MEAEKSHNMPFASWRPKEYCHSSQRPDKCTSIECEGRRKPMLQFISHAERENSLFLYPFGLFRPSLDWIMLTHIGEGNESVHQFKCSVHQFKYWCLLKTSSQTLSEIMFCEISGHPESQSNWHLKLTIPPHFTKVILARIQRVRAVILYNYSSVNMLFSSMPVWLPEDGFLDCIILFQNN